MRPGGSGHSITSVVVMSSLSGGLIMKSLTEQGDAASVGQLIFYIFGTPAEF
jgi:hypothetical protein